MRPEIPIEIDSAAGFNVYLSGPRKPRVVIGKALYDSLARDEVMAICGHELGHYNLWHIERCWAGLIAVYLSAFACLFLGPWYLGATRAAAIAIVGLVLVKLMSMWHELEADFYAARAFGVPLYRRAYLKVLVGPPTRLTRLRLRFLDRLESWT